MEIRRTARAAEITTAIQFRGHGDGIRGLTAGIEIQHHVIDRLVCRLVEVAGLDLLHDVGDRVLTEQHSAQHGLLGHEVLGRSATELTATTAILRRRRKIAGTVKPSLRHDRSSPLSARTHLARPRPSDHSTVGHRTDTPGAHPTKLSTGLSTIASRHLWTAVDGWGLPGGYAGTMGVSLWTTSGIPRTPPEKPQVILTFTDDGPRGERRIARHVRGHNG